KPKKKVSDAALSALVAYSWPGNVRELANVLERALILSRSPGIEPGDLPETCLPGRDTNSLELDHAVKEFTRAHIRKTLGLCDGDKKEAARKLGVGLSSLYRKLDELGIETDETRDPHRGRHQ
ncbi:sigma-54-dependent Fis family transcriptional regulator, partial [bacterium]|nr:sigma-54-dependent Fis family transcriptional regulator [bacterium]